MDFRQLNRPRKTRSKQKETKFVEQNWNFLNLERI